MSPSPLLWFKITSRKMEKHLYALLSTQPRRHASYTTLGYRQACLCLRWCWSNLVMLHCHRIRQD